MYNNIRVLLSCTLIVLSTHTESQIILLPDGLANVCPGEEFTLTCSTNQSDFVKWTVQFPILQDTTNSPSRSWLISKSGTSVMFNLSVAEDPNAFSISRNSESESLPLISSLTITNVTTSWNGTVVNCTEVGDAVTESNISMAAVTIQVITSDIDYLRSTALQLNISHEVLQFGERTVVVVVQWSNVYHGNSVSYNINIEPEAAAPLTQSVQSPFNLTMHYNRGYNVSIKASLCGHKLTNSNTISLKYVNCGNPLHQASDTSLGVLNFSAPMLQGDTLSFVCSPEHLLTGPNMSTCMENGEWEPDPRDIKCISDCGDISNDTIIGVVYSSTLEASLLEFWCRNNPDEVFTASCQRNASWTPDPNSSCTLNQSGSESDVNLISVFVSAPLISGITLILVGGVCAAIILLIRSKRGPKQKRRLITTNAYSDHNTLSSTRQIFNTRQEAGGQKRLIYADIGPISSAKRRIHASIIHDDDRVEYSQVITMHEAVRQGLPKLEKEKNTTSSLDNLLNLDTLLLQLQNKVTPKWYQFGEAVGIDKETLDKYTEYSDDQCIVEVLDYWLRNHTGQPTWREVAEILRGIDLQLASDIEKIYETGELLINANKVSQEIFLEVATESVPPPIPPRE